MRGRSDLLPIVRSMHKLVVAIDERERGFDEPLLDVNKSPRSLREDRYTRCVKTQCAMAARALIAVGLTQSSAAEAVAKVVNRNVFLPVKRSGLSVVARSVINWMTRWDAGDLTFWCDPDIEFRLALGLFEEGKPKAAQRCVLTTLTEILKERWKYRLYPEERGITDADPGKTPLKNGD